MTALGIRLNNPGDIRKSATQWQGLADSQPDPNFCSFKTPQYGIRAMARNLMNYQAHDNCHTVRQIIARYAPPSENNTGAYISAICSALKAAGFSDNPDAEINVDTVDVMKPLIVAIIIHETGSNPYSDAVITEGLRMAGIADAKPPPLATQHTFQTQVGAGVAVVGAAGAHVAQYAPTVKGWADQLGDYAGAPLIQHAVTILLTVAGGLVLLGIASQFLKQKAA